MVMDMSILPNTRKTTVGEGLGTDLLPSSVRAVVVHFLSYGRNAWNATWIMRYRTGDFLRDGRVVKSMVEARRSPGTVFYLNVLPAFQIDYGARKFLVAEINNNQPFLHIDLDKARHAMFFNGMDGFLDLIAPTSGSWLPGQSRENSIVVQEVVEDFMDLTAYSALATGRDASTNPPIGNYKRYIAQDHWWWDATAAKISLESYAQMLEALVESRERLAG
jgi:hypothetical protein